MQGSSDMRRFSIYKRNSIYYVRFWNDETKTYTSGISTGETVEYLAEAKATYWQINGIDEKTTVDDVVNRKSLFFYLKETKLDRETVKNILKILKDKNLLHDQADFNKTAELPIVEYLTNFWNYDTSEYVKENKIGKRHCYDMSSRIKQWESFFGNKKINEIQKSDIRDFRSFLRISLSEKTIKNSLNVGGAAFQWLVKMEHISNNPIKELRESENKNKKTVKTKRGILTIGQVQKIFSIKWNDERCRVGSLIAMACGLRLGEILALKLADIGMNRLFIRHSWSFADGLKCPKNGEERTVPLLPAVRKELLNLLDSSPWGKSGFIFYGADSKEKPMNSDTMANGFYKELEKIGLSNKERLEKKICFHSWRHFFTENLANETDIRTVQMGTGHKTVEMAEYYANHESEKNFDKLTNAMNSVFGNLVPFVKEA